MNDVLLELRDVCYAYEDSAFSLQNLSVQVRQGEKVAVLGNNGAGKSTFFLLCNGVHTPKSGTLLYRGRKIGKNRTDLLHLRARVGIVFQDPNQQLIGSTVEAEVSFGPMNLALPHDEVSRRIDEALHAMRLEPYRTRPPHDLSGGEKKRVSIAGVLAMHPEIILFDEPTASLDPAGVDMLEDVLAQLEQQGKTLLISTHDIDFAWRWATRVLVFSGGKLCADDTPETIFADNALLRQAGLRRPYLYDAALLLQKHGMLPKTAPLPKTIAALEQSLLPENAQANRRATGKRYTKDVTI